MGDLKTTRAALTSSAIGCAVCFLLALAVYVAVSYGLPQPLHGQHSPEVTERLSKIDDIDHLRKVALLLDSQIRETRREFNEVFEAAVDVLISAFLLGGIFCLLNLGFLLKLRREQEGKPLSWWMRGL